MRYFVFAVAGVLLAATAPLPTRVSAQATPRVVISEVHSAGNSNGTYNADWFELTNMGTTTVDLTGWKVDDDSNSPASAVALRTVTQLTPGQSAVFINTDAAGTTDATVIANFSTAWFGTPTPPAGLLVGTYGGSGIGLSGTTDAVNIFDSADVRVTGIRFDAADAVAPISTFDNTAAAGSTTLPLPSVTAYSEAGTNGAFISTDSFEIGSPGSRRAAKPLTEIDLSMYVRVGRFELPEPTRTTPPAGSLLAQEASAVTYNWDTDTLFVVGDRGTSIVQVTKTGQLVDSMTLAAGGSPQGTEFYDIEGLTYVGAGNFVMVQERDRIAVLFKYEAGTTLTRAVTRGVTLGTSIGNEGLEGLSYDPPGESFVFSKESNPLGIFQTGIDFLNGTATNGSPTTVNSTNLFDPALGGLGDFADVYALTNLPGLTAPQRNNLLILSQDSGAIVNIDRLGVIASTLIIAADPGTPISVADQQHEGLTMDGNGVLYVVNENGGGDPNHPELWVYAPSDQPNQAPTAISLTGVTSTLPENTVTTLRLRVANVIVTDDGLGTNVLSVSGADAAAFEVDNTGLYIKAGTVLDFETKSSYSVTVEVDDDSIGATPDATTSYALTLTDVEPEIPPAPVSIVVSEVTPWASGFAPYAADWFELTNTGAEAVNITGWRVDDDSAAFGTALALAGVTSIAPGESVIFMETASDATKAAFRTAWFGPNPPATLQVGSYSGGGIGLSTGGDQVNIFDAAGNLVTGVAVPVSVTGSTFDNAAGLGASAPPLPTISTLSVAGTNGAFLALDGHGTGSPGTISGSGGVSPVIISEVAPWGSGDGAYTADWFEVTNISAAAVDISGWKVDDDSAAFATAIALTGVTSIAPGESVIFMETNDLPTKKAAFLSTWFGASLPATLQIGSYTGSGIGFGSGGDQVNLFNAAGTLVTGIAVPASTSKVSFDNAAGLGASAPPVPSVPTLSAVGTNGAFLSAANNETGSPGTIENVVVLPELAITEVTPWGSGDPAYEADWFEVTNVGATPVDLTGFRVDDSSNNFASAIALTGISTIAPGESVIFMETDGTDPRAAFLTAWFGAAPPAGLQVGTYTGSGIGLSTDGDAVVLFDASGNRVTGVSVGISSTGFTFDNAARLGSTAAPFPAIETLSVVGVNGAFLSANGLQRGSPGSAIFAPAPPELVISEIAPWGSDSVYDADWFEITNVGATPVTLTGFRMNDDTATFADGVALTGVTTLAAGKSAIFLETADLATTRAAFLTAWFGGNPPGDIQIGGYTGSGVGLGTGGDAVTIFDSFGTLVTGVATGSSGVGVSFDNAAGLGSATAPFPTVSTLSQVGVNGGFSSSDESETGSPGRIVNPPILPPLVISEITPWASGDAPYEADWFEVTNIGDAPVDLTGFRVDDSSNSFASALPLVGVTTIAAGESVIFIESDDPDATKAAFLAAWFGATAPAGLQIGTYTGSGIGLATGGDSVNLFDAAGNRVTGVAVGPSTTGFTFDNAAGLGSTTLPLPTVATLSVAGSNGAFLAADGTETGSPGRIAEPADTTAPTIDPMADIIVGATGPSGAVVSYVSPATHDDVDGDGVATCTPGSGTTFPIGTTTVTCTAQDVAGNAATPTTFTVRVAELPDVTAPIVDAVANITVDATGPSGAVVSYVSPATHDDVDGAGIAACTPGSGSTFPIGVTTVTCTAQDAAGNVATPRTFTVTVRDVPPTAPTAPSAPREFAAVVIGNTVTLSWSAPASGAPTSYTVMARTTGGQLILTLPVGLQTSLTVAAPNGAFVVSVLASNGVGSGPESNTVTLNVPGVPPVPSSPTNLAVSVNGDGATFTWTPPAPLGVAQGYLLAAGTTQNFTTPLVVLQLPAGNTTTIGAIPPGNYWLRLYAGNVSGTSGPSNEVSISVAVPTAPGVPTLHPATVEGHNVGLSWSPGNGGVPTSYLIGVAASPGGAPALILPLTGTSANFAGVPTGTYYLRMVALNGVGMSSISNEITLVVP